MSWLSDVFFYTLGQNSNSHSECEEETEEPLKKNEKKADTIKGSAETIRLLTLFQKKEQVALEKYRKANG